MKTIVLDLTGCKYLDELHKRIKESFGFPDWYGENWSAFWDLLWSECDANKVIIKGESSLSEELALFLPKIHKILEKNVDFRKKHSLESFSFEVID